MQIQDYNLEPINLCAHSQHSAQLVHSKLSLGSLNQSDFQNSTYLDKAKPLAPA